MTKVEIALPGQAGADTIALPVAQPLGGDSVRLVDEKLGGRLSRLGETGELRGDRGEAVLLYLDGDLAGLSEDLIERMVQPIADNEADFVKAKFTRAAGRVTVLTAKPLLKTYFPELAHFDQPLSGIIAARRSLLQTMRFENDYGVDIGLLIDAAIATSIG